jgi:hypothetical protein
MFDAEAGKSSPRSMINTITNDNSFLDNIRISTPVFITKLN